MKAIKNMLAFAKKLHASEQGAEGLEKILILAAIVIPLLGVLLIFRKSITEWVGNAWSDMTGKANISNPNPAVP